MILNKEQLECSQKLKDFINGEKNGFFLIDGAGGTGKTTVVTSIMDDSNNFLFLGATNKVCKNIYDSLEKNGAFTYGLTVKTIARFLNWRRTKDHENEDVFTMEFPSVDTIPKVVVIDEVSMLKYEQVEYVLKLKNIRKVILIGDKMQIPPIEKNEEKHRGADGFLVSKIFDHIDHSYTLTIQNRQNADSPLYKAINEFRSIMHTQVDYNQFAEKYVNNKDIFLMNLYSNEFRVFVDNNKCTSVTYKNVTSMSHLWVLNRYNNPNDLRVGDTVYFKRYYKNNIDVFYSSENCLIKEKEEALIDVQFPNGEIIKIPIYLVKVKTDLDFIYTLRVSKSYKETYSKVKRKVDNIAESLKKTNNKTKLSEIHTFYSNLRTSMASLSKPYAITTHKAQGSTYDNVIIPIYDFKSNYNHRDSNQLFYVAMSRAKSKIIFVNVDSNFSNDTNRVNFTQQERHMIALKTNFQCSTIIRYYKDGTPVYCEHYFENVREFEVDHIKPLKDGGDNSVGNLQILCKECHKKKSYERSI